MGKGGGMVGVDEEDGDAGKLIKNKNTSSTGYFSKYIKSNIIKIQKQRGM